ncbi:MAG: FeS-binding protein, partial [Bacteroidia bacterium]|nr:FeS-binding protein [Bacteroidia bacterium]
MSDKINHSMSLANPHAEGISTKLKLALGLGLIGFFILVLALFNINFSNRGLIVTTALLLITIGVVLYTHALYASKLQGIKNDGVWFKSISSKGTLGWLTGVLIT